MASVKSARISKAASALAKKNRDRELSEKIESHLPRHAGRGRLQVGVEVDNGFVVLQGCVRTFREKNRLHRFVMSLHGVKALKDLLRVEPQESLADEKVALHVRQSLEAHSELPPGTAAVHVHKGACTLKGHVRTAEERHIAEMVSRNCRGVKAVVNELTVDTLDEVSDEATARVVKAALAYCKDFDIDGISVSCADGRVILRGLVPTLMDLTLAEEIARIQPGVSRVENHIQIKQDPAANGSESGPRKAVRARAVAAKR